MKETNKGVETRDSEGGDAVVAEEGVKE